MTHAAEWSEFLQATEVKDLTGRAKPDDQETELKRLGVPCQRPRPNRVLVSRFHVREWLSGRTVTPSRGVNLAAIEEWEAKRAKTKKAAAEKKAAEKAAAEKRALKAQSAVGP